MKKFTSAILAYLFFSVSPIGALTYNSIYDGPLIVKLEITHNNGSVEVRDYTVSVGRCITGNLSNGNFEIGKAGSALSAVVITASVGDISETVNVDGKDYEAVIEASGLSEQQIMDAAASLGINLSVSKQMTGGDKGPDTIALRKACKVYIDQLSEQ